VRHKKREKDKKRDTERRQREKTKRRRERSGRKVRRRVRWRPRERSLPRQLTDHSERSNRTHSPLSAERREIMRVHCVECLFVWEERLSPARERKRETLPQEREGEYTVKRAKDFWSGRRGAMHSIRLPRHSLSRERRSNGKWMQLNREFLSESRTLCEVSLQRSAPISDATAPTKATDKREESRTAPLQPSVSHDCTQPVYCFPSYLKCPQ